MSGQTLRIGTSGWHYKHWRNSFYPSDLPAADWFSWYAKHFDTVELNNSFYRLPTEDAFLAWKKTAPSDFLFSVKASRFITHMKRLTDPESTVEKFLSRAKLLGSKLGPVLFQFPQQWAVNEERLSNFLRILPPKLQYVFEFRHASWLDPPIYRILRQYNAALCIHDWQGVAWPMELTADFTYVRLHGPTGTYSGSYSKRSLERWAQRIEGWRNSKKSVFVYFNNDTGGHALSNAMTLKNLLKNA